MRIVDRPALRPMRCAAIPYIGATHNGKFIDTGSEMTGGFDNRVYISDVAVGDMARMLGFVAKGEHRQMADRVAQLEAELERAHAEIADLERVQQAIDVLESKGYRSRRKPGRPKQEATSA